MVNLPIGPTIMILLIIVLCAISFSSEIFKEKK